MFITAVCVLFLIKLRWPKNKSIYNRKLGMGFQFEQHRLGLWDLSWDLKKTIS